MYRITRRFIFRSVLAAFSAALLAACGGGGGGSNGSTLPQTANQNGNGSNDWLTGSGPGREWYVTAGADRRDGALEALDFFSNTLTIDAGDSVTWTVAASEHTISFLTKDQTPFTAPLAPSGSDIEDGSTFTSSGVLAIGQTYHLTFPKPGEYDYYCLLHPPEMTGKIVVQPAGTAYPHPQGFYTGQGNATANNELSAAQAAVALFPFADGGTTVAAGISPGLTSGPPSHSTVYRFLDADNLIATTITIPVNTTVTWVNETNNEPHTVTFPVAGQPLPPNIAENPFSPPSGGSTYDGSTLTNSGPFGSAVGIPTNEYSLKFTKRGSFVYYCLFHDEFGMVGVVNVQ